MCIRDSSQDMVYFDRHKGGELNRRMQGEAQRLAEVIYEVPKKLILNVVQLFVCGYVVWNNCQEVELLVVMTVSPLCMALQHMGICRMLMPMWHRRSGLRTVLSQSASEIIRKIRTVREFGQEVDEADLRAARDCYTVENDMQVKSTESTCWHSWPTGGDAYSSTRLLSCIAFHNVNMRARSWRASSSNCAADGGGVGVGVVLAAARTDVHAPMAGMTAPRLVP